MCRNCNQIIPETPGHDRVQEMAKVIVDTTREKGEVTRHDLLANGFTPAEIDRLGDYAMAVSLTAPHRGPQPTSRGGAATQQQQGSLNMTKEQTDKAFAAEFDVDKYLAQQEAKEQKKAAKKAAGETGLPLYFGLPEE